MFLFVSFVVTSEIRAFARRCSESRLSLPWLELIGALPRSSAVRHGCRRAYSGEPPSQPSTPIDAGRRGKAVGGDLIVGALTGDELWPISAVLYLCVSNMWVPVDRGPQLSA